LVVGCEWRERESVLFIGTQFSNLYTAVDTAVVWERFLNTGDMLCTYDDSCPAASIIPNARDKRGPGHSLFHLSCL